MSTQNTIYDSFNTNYLVQNIETSKGTSPLENRIEFIEYDSRGNPLEISKADGTHIINVWGYNKQYPIVKIENASYLTTQVNTITVEQQTLIDNVVTAANNDVSKSLENVLISTQELLRAGFPNALITTYTFDPLIGVTSTTDSKGYSTFYGYDDLNRLKWIKDDQDNILKDFNYNYKVQNNQ